jgi:hypothetical protein
MPKKKTVAELQDELTTLRSEHAALQARFRAIEATLPPPRKLVEGEFSGRRSICALGGDPSATCCETRSALLFSGGWWLLEPGQEEAFAQYRSEAEAYLWVCEGLRP